MQQHPLVRCLRSIIDTNIPGPHPLSFDTASDGLKVIKVEVQSLIQRVQDCYLGCRIIPFIANPLADNVTVSLFYKGIIILLATPAPSDVYLLSLALLKKMEV
jgi:hypothetical protein